MKDPKSAIGCSPARELRSQRGNLLSEAARIEHMSRSVSKPDFSLVNQLMTANLSVLVKPAIGTELTTISVSGHPGSWRTARM